jgi:hypothetical protein
LWAFGGCFWQAKNDLHQALLRCKMQPAAGFPRRIWRLRSLIIQAKYGTLVVDLLDEKGEAMRKTLMALAAAAAVALSATAPAHAQRGFGAGLAAGVIGGAIVGGALAGPGYGYGPGYYGYGGPAYVGGGYYGGCVWQRQRFWDGYGWRVRRVRVCG